tara:strand:+ start:368 stop:568 length:201 start_codon:yes stop_codon:yes gene_type:complete
MNTPFKMKYKNNSFPFRTDLTKKTGLGPRETKTLTRSEFDKDLQDYDKKDAIHTRIAEGHVNYKGR